MSKGEGKSGKYELIGQVMGACLRGKENLEGAGINLSVFSLFSVFCFLSTELITFMYVYPCAYNCAEK